MHLAVDANCLAWGWGGIPRYVARLIELMAQRGDMRIDLLANTHEPFARIPGTTEVCVRRRGGALWRNTVVAPWLARRRPDVFWAPETATPVLVPVPFAVTVHDLAPVILPGIKPPLHGARFRTTIRRSTRAADRVVAVSRATALDLERLWGVTDADVVLNGVDERFTPGDREAARSRVRERLGVDGPFVAAVGALEPRKGLEVLIEAADQAARDGAAWRLVLAGKPGYRGESIAAAAAASVACTHIGGVGEDDLLDLYRAADALATPSLYEGFGFTPLEAMACGTPAVVAAGAGALEEVAGGAAVVVRERTAAAWRSGVEEAMARRAELVPLGMEHARGFSWPAAAEATRLVLEEAAGASAGPARG